MLEKRLVKWGGNEVEQLVYPSEDTEVLAQRRLESTALRRALAAGNRRAAGAWAARALAARQERFARLTDPSVAYGNSSGSLELLGRRCLTEGAGKHPLFEGVRRATITGLPSEPRIEEADGAVKISENGLTLKFRGARVTRDGQTVKITLRDQRGVPRADPSLRSG